MPLLTRSTGGDAAAHSEYRQLIAVSRPQAPMPIPFGWYCVLYSDELQAKTSMPLKYFDTDLVLFRTEAGRAVLFDAYCPHLGAHLGYGIHEESGQGGRIQGETIACPFHGWRFNVDGEVVEIPYAEKIPPKARGKACIRSWPVCEANGAIYTWYHPDRIEPMWQLPDHPEAGGEQWSEQQRYEGLVRTHIQEMAENSADMAHFLFVHRTADIPRWDIHYDKHTSKGDQEMRFPTPQGVVDGMVITYANGPGHTTTRFTGLCETFLLGLPTPVDTSLVHMRFAFTQQRGDEDNPLSKALVQNLVSQFDEDKPIWDRKLYRQTPMLCDGDGPIMRFRKWYNQFYHDFEQGPA